MRPAVPALLASLVLSTTAASAHAEANIVQTWQTFIASRIAAKDCGGLDPAVDARFMGNFTEVTLEASRAVAGYQPQASNDAIVADFKTLARGIHDRVDAEVKANGCASPRIQRLLAQYRANAAAPP
jgi:hypothetical protein